MTTVAVSSNYQVVVPKAARQALRLEPGQKLAVLVYEGRLELVPVRDLESVRGFCGASIPTCRGRETACEPGGFLGLARVFRRCPRRRLFRPRRSRYPRLLAPATSLLEVFKRVCQQRGENAALEAVALMHQGRIVDLDAGVALSAAKLDLDHRLPLADSVMLATARRHGAVPWTQDADFEGLEGVRSVPRQ